MAFSLQKCNWAYFPPNNKDLKKKRRNIEQISKIGTWAKTNATNVDLAPDTL